MTNEDKLITEKVTYTVQMSIHEITEVLRKNTLEFDKKDKWLIVGRIINYFFRKQYNFEMTFNDEE